MRRLIAAIVAACTTLGIVALAPAPAGAFVKHPGCIVSLSPTATETLFAIGAGRQVRAVGIDDNFPRHGLPKRRIDAFNPSAESIATICQVTKHHSAKPDVVVISYDANHIAERLGALGIKVLMQDAPTTLDGAYAQIIALGHFSGHDYRAHRVVRRIKRTMASDVAAIAKLPHRTVRVYYELDPTLYSLTSRTFVGSIMKRLGMTNVADAVGTAGDGGYPQLNREFLLASNPSLVILADSVCCHANAKTFAQRAGFSTMSAVRHAHVIVINDDVASRWGPRLKRLIFRLTQGVRSVLTAPSTR